MKTLQISRFTAVLLTAVFLTFLNTVAIAGDQSGFEIGQIIVPEYGDRIVKVNNIPIRDMDHFSDVIYNADTHIHFTLIDRRTGNAYRFSADLWPRGSSTRLGIYVEDHPNGGVLVTGVIPGTPGTRTRYQGMDHGGVIIPPPAPQQGYTPGQIIVPEYGDRITEVNNIPIRGKDHFTSVIKNAGSHITFTLIDQRTGNAYKFAADLWPRDAYTRLGIYIVDDRRGGVMVTGVMSGTPGTRTRYLGFANDFDDDDDNSGFDDSVLASVVNNTPPNLGKLYVLTVWAGGDLTKYTCDFSGFFSGMMRANGLIPISHYENPRNFIDFCAEEISIVGNFILPSATNPNNTEVLDNDKSSEHKFTNNDVLEACRYLSRKAGKNDVIFVYMVCHGKTARIGGDTKRHHILFPAIESQFDMQDNSNGILRSEIIKALDPDSHRLTVLITDSCTYYQDYEAKPEAPPLLQAIEPERFRINRLWLLLRTNTGLIDWNSTSPYGGNEEQGEYTLFYEGKDDSRSDDSRSRGIFQESFLQYCSEPIEQSTKNFAADVFFKGLKAVQIKRYNDCKNDTYIKELGKGVFDIQPSQTLFDFKGLGYVFK